MPEDEQKLDELPPPDPDAEGLIPIVPFVPLGEVEDGD